ncbi:UNVERIFIED_CONTAM: hypothetical protein GTU68_002261 [Idotea baltica]|nr:hypothetical protein [Idotea baltica]
MKALVVCSGGLDSVTLAYKVAKEGTLTSLLSFNYGQRHSKELDFAARCAKQLEVPHIIIDLSQVGAQLTGSALTDDIDIPDGHYAEDSMKVTVVPNRNAIMMTIAFGLATSQKANAVAMAVHGGDHFIYPDCRPEFIESFAKMQNHALEGLNESDGASYNIELYTPYLHKDKTEIARDSHKYNVPVVDTWSCYKGLDKHCGRCGTCVERREAFHLAEIKDPTVYEDADYWLEVVNREPK